MVLSQLKRLIGFESEIDESVKKMPQNQRQEIIRQVCDDIAILRVLEEIPPLAIIALPGTAQSQIREKKKLLRKLGVKNVKRITKEAAERLQSMSLEEINARAQNFMRYN